MYNDLKNDIEKWADGLIAECELPFELKLYITLCDKGYEDIAEDVTEIVRVFMVNKFYSEIAKRPDYVLIKSFIDRLVNVSGHLAKLVECFSEEATYKELTDILEEY